MYTYMIYSKRSLYDHPVKKEGTKQERKIPYS